MDLIGILGVLFLVWLGRLAVSLWQLRRIVKDRDWRLLHVDVKWHGGLQVTKEGGEPASNDVGQPGAQ